MPSDDGADNHWDHGGVAELKVSKEGDQDALPDQVDDPADAAVVAVLHHAPAVSRSHVVEADDELAEEGEEDGQHDRGVVEQVEPLVVGSPLEARVEAVLDVVKAEGIPSLLDSSLLFSFNSSRVPL